MKQESIILSMLVLLFWGLLLNGCSGDSYDVMILNGTVYDGEGGEPRQVDIGIKKGKVAALGNLKNQEAAKIIDASGLSVAPGFIDLHAHIEAIESIPHALSKLHQGVTTTLGGPDGFSPFPIKGYLEGLDSMLLGVNTAYLVGHNTIRRRVMNLDDRAPTEEELAEMYGMVEEAMDGGAFGISTGLKYLPGAFSKVDEVIELSKAAAKTGGFYTSHLREEGLGLIEGVQEAIEIGDKANIPIVLTHHKMVGKPTWGKSKITLAMVDSANNAGLDIQIDQYPYTASYTGISILIPAWAREGGNKKFIERVNNPRLRKKIKDEIVFNILNDRGAGNIKNVQFSIVKWEPELENKTLADWAVSKGMEPTPENGAELVIEAQTNGGASAIFHAMSEDDVKRIMQHPKTMIASDGRLSKFNSGHPHPRVYGTNPRVLGKYVREDKVLKLEEAIKKMTGLPAARMGLKDRGVIKEGSYADIVIFDPEKVIDKATFSEPHQYPEGINYVIVNGVISIENGEETGEYGGVVLRKENN